MPEVPAALLRTLCLISCVVFCSCATSVDESAGDGGLPIKFSPMYSAYDGKHTFQVTPSASAMNWDGEDSAIVASTVRWTVDRSFVEVGDFDALPNGVLLTMKRAGKTKIRVQAMTLAGAKKTGEALLSISQVSRDEWEAGSTYYHQTGGITERRLGSYCGEAAELTAKLPGLLPGCSNCHAEGGSLAKPPTPTQTAGLDDEQLLQVFSNAAELPSGNSGSRFLQQFPEPECALKIFHSRELTEQEKKGMVWELRAIAPAIYQEPEAAEDPR